MVKVISQSFFFSFFSLSVDFFFLVLDGQTNLSDVLIYIYVLPLLGKQV